MSQQPGPADPWAAPQQPQQPAPQTNGAPFPPPAQPYGAAPQPPYGAPPPPYGAPQGYPPIWAPPAPPRRSRKPWIIGGAVALSLVLGGGGVFAYLMYDKVSSLGTRKVVPPAEFQGQSRAGHAATEENLRASMGRAFADNPHVRGALTPVAAVYGGGDGRGEFIMWGAYGKILDPGSEADQAFDAMARTGYQVGARSAYDPGPLGGTLRCATVGKGGRTWAHCIWADGSSVVIVLDGSSPTADLAATAARTRAFRTAAEVPR